MREHKGKIVEQAIKRSGYQMKALAQKLGIARNTLYTKMREIELEDAFIIKIGSIIHYDFTIDFPYLIIEGHPCTEEAQTNYTNAWHRNPDFAQLQALNKKYLNLLEDYNKLLRILILLANNNDLMGIKAEIATFLENEEKEN